jgi:CRISPR-associated protein Cas5t
VVIGRSQDLAAYRSVEIASLEKREAGYYEYTLLPWSYRPRTPTGASVLMPRYINPDDRREVSWARYVTLEHRIFHPRPAETIAPAMLIESADEALWVDPSSLSVRDRQRIIVWHSLRGEDGESLDPGLAA